MAKCAECGFLSLRNIETRALDEAEETFRKDGKTVGVERSYPAEIGMARFRIEEAVTRYVHEKLPLCFQGSYDLRVLISQLMDDEECDIYECIKTITHKDRECDLFTSWQQGSTPKEHREMIDRQKFMEWQERQRKDDRRWRIIELIVLGFIAVVVAGGFTILGAFIERGSLFP